MDETRRAPDAAELERWDRLESILEDQPSLVGSAGQVAELPSSALALLREGISLLRDGGEIALLSASTEVSAAEAADILNVRQPYLESLLSSGELPSSEGDGETRIPIGALLAYKRKRDANRLHNLNELVRADQGEGLYEREWKDGW
jgi:hypothetical protein